MSVSSFGTSLGKEDAMMFTAHSWRPATCLVFLLSGTASTASAFLQGEWPCVPGWPRRRRLGVSRRLMTWPARAQLRSVSRTCAPGKRLQANGQPQTVRIVSHGRVDPYGARKVWLALATQVSAAQEERLRVGPQCCCARFGIGTLVTVFSCTDHLRVAKWDVTLQQDPLTSKFVKKAHDDCDDVLDQVLQSDRRHARERLNVNSVQDGNHRARLRAVLTCSRLQDHVVELYLWNPRLAPVSATVMVVCCNILDAVVAPTAWREVCHPVCRACTVVREDWHLLE